MVRTIYLIRHGETEGHSDGEPRYKGTIDVPLSERGHRQARATAAHMARASLAPNAIYCSDLSRARHTAEAIGAAFGLAPVVDAGLRERHFGLWEGMSFNEIKERYPNEFGAWASDPLAFSPMGGESTLDVRDRVIPAIERIAAGHDGEDIAIVAHGGVNRVVLGHYAGLPLNQLFHIEQDFACLNIIRFYDGFPVLKLMNATFGELA